MPFGAVKHAEMHRAGAAVSSAGAGDTSRVGSYERARLFDLQARHEGRLSALLEEAVCTASWRSLTSATAIALAWALRIRSVQSAP